MVIHNPKVGGSIPPPATNISNYFNHFPRIPIGKTITNAIKHCHPESIYSCRTTVLRDSMTQYDVQHEERAISKGEQVAERREERS